MWLFNFSFFFCNSPYSFVSLIVDLAFHSLLPYWPYPTSQRALQHINFSKPQLSIEKWFYVWSESNAEALVQLLKKKKKEKNVTCRIRTHDLSIYIPKSQRACWSVGHRAERFQRVPHALLTMVKLVDFISCKRISRQLFSRKIALKWIKWEEKSHFSTLCAMNEIGLFLLLFSTYR